MYVDIIYLCTVITVMSSLAFGWPRCLWTYLCTVMSSLLFGWPRCLWTYLCTVMYSLAFVRARYVCGHNLSLYCDYCDVQFGVCLHEMSVDISLYCDVQFVVWLAEMSVDIISVL